MTAGQTPVINIHQSDKRWLTFYPHPEKDVRQVIAEALEIIPNDLSSQEVSVVFTNDAEIHSLNKSFRQVDRPTNVLSFPSENEGELGDIILAYETVVRESKENDISNLNHTTHLILHGFLHLLGYDHEIEEDAEIMETLEILILKRLMIPNPYEAQ